MHRVSLLIVASAGLALGCMPRVMVKPNPGPHARGIRYYRPKPYLLITPFTQETTTTKKPGNSSSSETSTSVTSVSDEYVTIKLEYLPDFSEEYAVDVRSGFGTNETQITLENGWNLTAINQKLDSKTAENINAVANLIKSIGGVALPARGAPAPGGEATPEPVHRHGVRARNVPLGYYESVWVRANRTKRLYGWRYVGFMPFAASPFDAAGAGAQYCQADAVYALVFESGVMMFKQLPRVEAIEPTFGLLDEADDLPVDGEERGPRATTPGKKSQKPRQQEAKEGDSAPPGAANGIQPPVENVPGVRD